MNFLRGLFSTTRCAGPPPPTKSAGNSEDVLKRVEAREKARAKRKKAGQRKPKALRKKGAKSSRDNPGAYRKLDFVVRQAINEGNVFQGCRASYRVHAFQPKMGEDGMPSNKMLSFGVMTWMGSPMLPNGAIVNFSGQTGYKKSMLMGEGNPITGEGNGQVNICPEGTPWEFYSQFMVDGQRDMINLGADYKLRDCTLGASARFTGDRQIYTFSHLQKLTRKATAGVQLQHELGKKATLSFVGQYGRLTKGAEQGDSSLWGVSLGGRGMSSLYYVQKFGPPLSIATRLQAHPTTHESKLELGAHWNAGLWDMNAFANSDGLVGMSYTTALPPLETAKFGVSGVLNHYEGESQFGVSFSVGD